MLELIIIAVSSLLLFAITLWKRRSPANLREIPALTRLYRTLGLSMEDGTRLHISLGHGSLLDAHGGSALAGLAIQGAKFPTYEQVLGVSKPKTLWVAPGDTWTWPTPP